MSSHLLTSLTIDNIDYKNLETWEKFVLFEMALDRLPKMHHYNALYEFIICNYDINLCCGQNNLTIPVVRKDQLSVSALGELSKRFDYIPQDRRIEILQIFLREGDLERTYQCIADWIVRVDALEAPKRNQWPFALPTEVQLKSLQKLLSVTPADHHNNLRCTFQITGYDAIKTAELIGIPIELVTEKDETVMEEFDELIKQLPEEERDGARTLFIANKYNIDVTCQHLQIKRFPIKTRKKRANKTINITGHFKAAPVPQAIAWPDRETGTPAFLAHQMQDHPNVVDLHFYKFDDARAALQEFIAFHRRENTGEVRIITGRGKNSTDLKHTISKMVSNELKNMGIDFKRNIQNTGEIIAIVKKLRS